MILDFYLLLFIPLQEILKVPIYGHPNQAGMLLRMKWRLSEFVLILWYVMLSNTGDWSNKTRLLTAIKMYGSRWLEYRKLRANLKKTMLSLNLTWESFLFCSLLEHFWQSLTLLVLQLKNPNFCLHQTWCSYMIPSCSS